MGKLTCASLIVSLAAFAACKVRTAPNEAKLKGATTASEQQSQVFHSLFFGAAKEQMGPDRYNAAKAFLLLQPSERLLNEPTSSTSESYFEELASRYRQVGPSNLYDSTRRTEPEASDPSEIDRILVGLREKTGEPLTMIIVPGVFGEFIDARAFEELFPKKDNPRPEGMAQAPDLYSRWLSRSPNSFKDTTADGRTLGLQDLVSVTSVDDGNGQALVNVLLFNTPTFSGESVGTIESRAKIFSRRLEMAFKKLEVYPKNIAFVGYSRGTMVGLEMLAQAAQAPEQHPWINNVKAMISLGGVVYGTPLSDQLDDPVDTSARQVDALRRFEASLDQGDSWASMSAVEKAKLELENGKDWIAFLKEMIEISRPTERLSPAQLLELAKSKAAEVGRIDVRPTWQMVARFWNLYKLNAPLGDQYPVNVRNFKALLRDVVSAVPELSEKARKQWWKTHTVPSRGIKYYSLNATMGREQELLNNPVGDIPGTVDAETLLSSYDNMVKVTAKDNGVGLKLNDSQVPMQLARFWPNIHPLLNANQGPLDVVFLGTAGTSHWGLALQEVNKLRDGQRHPFPRRALFRAFAATVAKGISEQE